VILFNALGIRDSGGLRVLQVELGKYNEETHPGYILVCNDSEYLKEIIENYKHVKNFKILIHKASGLWSRLYYENVVFKKIVNKYNVDIIYNFSGSSQPFIKTLQLIKMQNLSFYSKELDDTYWRQYSFMSWIKQVLIKRVILNLIRPKRAYIEIQSQHVEAEMANFVNTKNMLFFIKSDVVVSDDEFCKPKSYDFSKTINILYIIGPHFESLHKNFIDFVKAMAVLEKQGVDFKINITLTYEQLNSSQIWDKSLNDKTNFLGYISDKEKVRDLFTNNTILVSTSIIETLGLHVIEGIKNGVITIAPDEEYANAVYGKEMFKYELFNKKALFDAIMTVINCKESYSGKILSIQDNLRQSEMSKFGSILDVFDEVLNVQK
jgi:glycosyltransferase involved in cell wall biosynthesis